MFLPTTKIQPLIETNRTVRHKRNFKILRGICAAFGLVLTGYILFFVNLSTKTPFLAIAIFLSGYLISWIKHGKLFQRIAKTKEYVRDCGFSYPVAWRRSGMVL